MNQKYTLQNIGSPGLTQITDDVQRVVTESGIRQGVCLLYTTDIDASILITSFYDTKGHEDILDDLERIFPNKTNIKFQGNAREGSAHAKSGLCGTSRDLIVEDGKLLLGGSEGIYFTNFDSCTEKTFHIKVWGI